jgi:hypothetical protein
MSLFQLSNRGQNGLGGYYLNIPRETGVLVVDKGIAALESAIGRAKALQAELPGTIDAVATAKANRAKQAKNEAKGKTSDLAGAIDAFHAAKKGLELLEDRIKAAQTEQSESTSAARALILSNEAELKKAAKPKIEAARDKVVTAARLLADAQVELKESAGVVAMFEHGDTYRHQVRQFAGALELGQALVSAGESVRAIGRDVEGN